MTPSNSPRLRPHHAVLLEFDQPLTQRQHEMLASDIHPMPHLTAVWHAGPDLAAGILVVRGRDAVLAGYAASCTCLSALGRDVPVQIAAVVRTDLVWPPTWWSAQP
ncbi:MAG TPA: hypothetical protein VHJ83_00830 [Micromonosporaceae bacterium]|nr:hypothetical protein [Micromonosporaceae bacterium]